MEYAVITQCTDRAAADTARRRRHHSTPPPALAATHPLVGLAGGYRGRGGGVEAARGAEGGVLGSFVATAARIVTARVHGAVSWYTFWVHDFSLHGFSARFLCTVSQHVLIARFLSTVS